MSTVHIPSNTLRDAKKLFARLKHLRCKLPVLNHLLLTAGQNGIELAATDLDHWLETRISDLPTDDACFLIPPAAVYPTLDPGELPSRCANRRRLRNPWSMRSAK